MTDEDDVRAVLVKLEPVVLLVALAGYEVPELVTSIPTGAAPTPAGELVVVRPETTRVEQGTPRPWTPFTAPAAVGLWVVPRYPVAAPAEASGPTLGLDRLAGTTDPAAIDLPTPDPGGAWLRLVWAPASTASWPVEPAALGSNGSAGFLAAITTRAPRPAAARCTRRGDGPHALGVQQRAPLDGESTLVERAGWLRSRCTTRRAVSAAHRRAGTGGDGNHELQVPPALALSDRRSQRPPSRSANVADRRHGGGASSSLVDVPSRSRSPPARSGPCPPEHANGRLTPSRIS
jgi:hypothetical protein